MVEFLSENSFMLNNYSLEFSKTVPNLKLRVSCCYPYSWLILLFKLPHGMSTACLPRAPNLDYSNRMLQNVSLCLKTYSQAVLNTYLDGSSKLTTDSSAATADGTYKFEITINKWVPVFEQAAPYLIIEHYCPLVSDNEYCFIVLAVCSELINDKLEFLLGSLNTW